MKDNNKWRGWAFDDFVRMTVLNDVFNNLINGSLTSFFNSVTRDAFRHMWE